MGSIITGYLDSLPSKKKEENDVLDNALGELMERIRTNTESSVHHIERNVHHPAYYGGADNVYEAIKVIEAYDMGFLDGNVLKYLLRAGKKTESPLEDYKKAKWYLDRLITQWENK